VQDFIKLSAVVYRNNLAENNTAVATADGNENDERTKRKERCDCAIMC